MGPEFMVNVLRSMIDMDLISKLKEIIGNKCKPCSFDLEIITPLYVYRMLGGTVAIDGIAKGLTHLRNNRYMMI